MGLAGLAQITSQRFADQTTAARWNILQELKVTRKQLLTLQSQLSFSILEKQKSPLQYSHLTYTSTVNR